MKKINKRRFLNTAIFIHFFNFFGIAQHATISPIKLNAPYAYLAKKTGEYDYKLFVGAPYSFGQTISFGNGNVKKGKDNKYRYYVDIEGSGSAQGSTLFSYHNFPFNGKHNDSDIVAIVIRYTHKDKKVEVNILVIELPAGDEYTTLPTDSIAYDCPYLFIADADSENIDQPLVFVPRKNYTYESEENNGKINCSDIKPVHKINFKAANPPFSPQSEFVDFKLNMNTCQIQDSILRSYIVEIYWSKSDPPKKSKAAGTTVRIKHTSVGDPCKFFFCKLKKLFRKKP